MRRPRMHDDEIETDVALVYVEGIPDGRDFFERMRAVAWRESGR